MVVDLASIPRKPGCYLFKNKGGEVIYVGKAKDLSKRVKSYFKKNGHDVKTRVLIENIESVDFFITDSEYEALLLENTLIKKHSPRYNINLKDSKRYAYIRMTGEEFPRLLIARKRGLRGEYYGPFVSGLSRDYVIEALRKIFGIRTCRKFPKRACIRYAMGLCSAPCIKAISKDNYLERVKACELVLKGRTKRLVTMLDKRMKLLSAEMHYEQALVIRNQITAVKELGEKQKMDRQKEYNEDIINYLIHKDKVYLTIFNSKQGLIENKLDFDFEYQEGVLEEFLIRYYSEHQIPREIILPERVSSIVPKFLRRISKKSVVIKVPKKGEKKELLDLVLKNIELAIFGDEKKLEDLMEKLKLGELPRVIECFDISHLSGTSTVASMVQFRNANPDKSNYRRFKIRTVEGIDDYLAMKEVVSRRYVRLKAEGQTMPNLIVIDGGKGQLSAVMEMMKAMFLKIPVISLAKREEEVFIPGRKTPVRLSKRSEALKLLQQVRNEAHRFAIKYNRLLRSKKIKEG